MIYKALTYMQYGEPAVVIKQLDRQASRLEGNQVRVRMIQSPINPSDLIPIRGAYKHRTVLPGIPGYDGVGIVEDIGPFVSKALLGQRVLPLRGEGTWLELVLAEADLLIPVPDELEDDTACQMYINPVTAWVLVHEVMKLQASSVLAINACASAIGRQVTQLASRLGIQVVAITRSHAHTHDLYEAGASLVINTAEEPLYDTVMDYTRGTGISVALDSVGGEAGEMLIRCVQPGGQLISIGLLSGIQANWSALSIEQRVQVQLFHLRHWNRTVSLSKWQHTFEQLFEAVQAGHLKLLPPSQKFHFDHYRHALKAAEQSLHAGKVVLTF